MYSLAKIRRTCVLVVIGLAAFSACKSAQTAAPIFVEPSTAPVSDEPTKDLPPDLYKQMPLFPGATIEHVRKPTRMMREILFSTDAELKSIATYYKEQFKKQNFQVTSTLIMPARRTWSCGFVYDGRPGSIMAYPNEQNKSRMTIALMYELPTKRDDSFLDPIEDFDVIGPGEAAQATSPATVSPKP